MVTRPRRHQPGQRALPSVPEDFAGSDVEYYADFNAVYTRYFTSDPPARAFVGAGTLLRGARYEVMGIAVRRS